MSTEADTCRKYITPALQATGWDDPPHSIAEQRTFTDGRVVPVGDKIQRLQQKRADYLLRYTRDFTLAVVETFVAFQVAWKLWSSRWNRDGAYCYPRRTPALHPRPGVQGGVVNHEAHERARRARKGFVRFVSFRPLRVSKAPLEQAFRVNLGAIEPLKH